MKRLFALTYDRSMARMEKAGFREVRERSIAQATGDVLEIGGGTGSNLPYYGSGVTSLTITEPYPPMLKRLEKKVREQGSPAEVVPAPAEELPFEAGSFDTVVSTLVLCGVEDQPRALREIRRVLAPGGRYLGVERASPWLAPFAEPEKRALAARAQTQGTRERAIRYREWRAILEDAGLGAECLAPVPGARVGAPWLRRLGNAARQIYVTIRVTR